MVKQHQQTCIFCGEVISAYFESSLVHLIELHKLKHKQVKVAKSYPIDYNVLVLTSFDKEFLAGCKVAV